MFPDAALYRNLASLHRAGVPWPEAMASAAGRTSQGQAASQALAGGTNLAEALEPHVDPLDVALIRAGERSGSLESCLERLAMRYDEESRDTSARRTALTYPVILAHIAALLLPLPDFIQGHFVRGLLWSGMVLLPLYAILWLTRRRRVGPDDTGHPGTTAPKANGLYRNAVEEADARALTALADGFDAGIPLNELLELSWKAGAGGRVAFDLYRGAPRVKSGDALGTIWQAVPGEIAQRMDVAEKTGELSDTCRHTASRLRFDVEQRRKRLAAVLPVVTMLVIGGIIGFRVISFYVNAYSQALSMGP